MHNITSASVKVMRSHDYCHFEVNLSVSEVVQPGGFTIEITPKDVDELRKEAARLADKAVEQYKVAKRAAATRDDLDAKWQYQQALKMPEGDRSPKAKAIIKYHQDEAFAARFDYDYDDRYEPPTNDDI